MVASEGQTFMMLCSALHSGVAELCCTVLRQSCVLVLCACSVTSDDT